MKEVSKAHAWVLAVAVGLVAMLVLAASSLAKPARFQPAVTVAPANANAAVTLTNDEGEQADEHEDEDEDEDEQGGDDTGEQDVKKKFGLRGIDLEAAGVKVHVDEDDAEVRVGASAGPTTLAEPPTQTTPVQAAPSSPLSSATPSTPAAERTQARKNRKKTGATASGSATASATASSAQAPAARTSAGTSTPRAAAGPSAKSNGKTNKDDRPRRRTVVRRIVDRVPPVYRLALFGLGTLAVGFALAGARERRRARKAESEALIDPLTGLANRRAFDRRLDEEWKRSERYDRPLGLVMVDLDGFKQINDTRGHKEGDRVLREAAARIADRLRAIDLAGRLGGDEFAALCPETPSEGLESLAGALESCLEGLPVGASIGYAAREEGDRNPSELLARADAAMYRQKQQHARAELLGASS